MYPRSRKGSSDPNQVERVLFRNYIHPYDDEPYVHAVAYSGRFVEEWRLYDDLLDEFLGYQHAQEIRNAVPEGHYFIVEGIVDCYVSGYEYQEADCDFYGVKHRKATKKEIKFYERNGYLWPPATRPLEELLADIEEEYQEMWMWVRTGALLRQHSRLDLFKVKRLFSSWVYECKLEEEGIRKIRA